MEVINTCNCYIEKLLKKPFAMHSIDEKQNMVNTGRPTPTMDITVKNKSCTRHFTDKLYNTHKWVAGCKYLNKYFCWPCLLFSVEQNIWCKDGYSDLNNIHKAAGKHCKNSQSHMKSVLALYKLGNIPKIETVFDNQYRENITKHNTLVKKNREIIRSLIDVVCYLGYQEPDFRGHFEGKGSITRGNYIELVNLLGKYNTTLGYHLESSTVFSGLSNNMQKDLINSISVILINEIKTEIKSCKFVSIISDETFDNSMKAQLSTILRFIDTNGEIQERFVGFQDVSENRSAMLLYPYIAETINKFDCNSKLISQSYDNEPVMSGEQNGLPRLVRNLCKNAIFLHCFAQRLNLVLSKSSNRISQSRNFFLSISSFSTYFSHSTNRTTALDAKIKKRLPTIAPPDWNLNGRLILTIKEYHEDMEELFEDIIENQDSKWDSESITIARGLQSVLNDFEFNFLLNLYSKIYPQTDILYEIFQSKHNDIIYCIKKIKDYVELLEKLENDFLPIWQLTKDQIDVPYLKKRRKCTVKQEVDIETTYRQLFKEIIDNMKEEISIRFNSLDDIIFLQLLDTTKYAVFRKCFPENLLTNLKKTYPSFFDFVALKAELSVLFCEKDIMNKTVIQLYEYFNKKNLDTCFQQFILLINLAMTLPLMSASGERCFSTLNRINTYMRNKTGEERLSSLAIISIEKKLLKSILLKDGMYDEIINEYAKNDTRIPLTYK